MARPKNIVVTGANRGIGLELVKQLITKFNPDNIFATYRDPENSKDLLQLASQNGNLHAVILDVRDTDKYADFVTNVESTTQGAGINLLINNSGFFNKENNTSLSQLDKADLMYHFEINTLAPMMLTKAFLPLLEKGSKANGSQPLGIGRAAVLQVSTNMGSIGDNTSGGAYGYRISKTALNQASKNMSLDLLPKGILVIPLHPGWVKTDMGGSNALITTEECVTGILSVLENLNEDTNGHFMRFDGKEALW
ncbi:C-factor [Orchesella cincta]|uniref:C-factor n=1 Tax=Orchesella cincta TaxID=48709 RepID=A0A1D2MID4_ORCCI|nr:C-factor [Orchesella cincta]